eukprot:scpid39984/ scgid11981/ 
MQLLKHDKEISLPIENYAAQSPCFCSCEMNGFSIVPRGRERKTCCGMLCGLVMIAKACNSECQRCFLFPFSCMSKLYLHMSALKTLCVGDTLLDCDSSPSSALPIKTHL